LCSRNTNLNHRIIPLPPPCYTDFSPIANGDFEFPGIPLQDWTTSSPTGITIANTPVTEAGTGPFHSVTFNIDYDDCSATLTQPSLQGLCPNQLYQLDFFMALDDVAATDNCFIEILLADQVFWRHRLPYSNYLGSPMKLENTLNGPENSEDEGGYHTHLLNSLAH
jgi:hypothetical protein